MKSNMLSSSPIRNLQYAIYPNYNIYEALDLQKSQIFERISLHLRNKHITLFDENKYKYHTMRADIKSVFSRCDILNRKYDFVLSEVERFILSKINKKIVTQQSIKKKEIAICSTEVQERKFIIPRIMEKEKRIANIAVVAKISHKGSSKVAKKDESSMRISCGKEEKNVTFMEKLREKYVSIEKNDNVRLKEKIKKYIQDKTVVKKHKEELNSKKNDISEFLDLKKNLRGSHVSRNKLKLEKVFSVEVLRKVTPEPMYKS